MHFSEKQTRNKMKRNHLLLTSLPLNACVYHPMLIVRLCYDNQLRHMKSLLHGIIINIYCVTFIHDDSNALCFMHTK